MINTIKYLVIRKNNIISTMKSSRKIIKAKVIERFIYLND